MKFINLIKKTYPIFIICTAIFFYLTFSFSSCEDPYIPDDNGNTDFPELIIYDFNGGDVEWVSIQASTSADSKVADAKQDRNDIIRSNDTLYIQLCNINDPDELPYTPFTQTGKFIVVLKHNASNKMYIKGALGGKPEFINGCVKIKWGGWLPINAK